MICLYIDHICFAARVNGGDYLIGKYLHMSREAVFYIRLYRMFATFECEWHFCLR